MAPKGKKDNEVLHRAKPKPKSKGFQPPERTKADVEDACLRQRKEQEDDRIHVIQVSNERKRMECKYIDEAFTMVDVPGKDPKEVPDIDEHWLRDDIRYLSFLPQDERCEDIVTYVALLRLTCSNFELLLHMPFHVFWSHMLLTTLPRVIESYLRFSQSQHTTRGHNLYSEEVDAKERLLSKLAFLMCIRSSKRGESAHERLSEKKFASALQTLWDVPTLLDLCTMYGRSNSNRVTSLVHEVFDGCPALFEELVLTSKALREALDESLKHATDKEETWVYVQDCLACLEALQSHFPLVDDDGSEDLKRLTSVCEVAVAKRKVEIISQARYAMCRIAEAKWKVDADDPVEKKERIFSDFEEWILAQDVHIVEDIVWAPVFEHWKRVKGIDEERIDYFIRLCGADVQSKAEQVQRLGPKHVGAASSSAVPTPPIITGEERRKIREVLDVLPHCGEGWAYLCLKHYERVDELIDATFSDRLHVALSVISTTLTMQGALELQKPAEEEIRIDDADRIQILQQVQRMDEEEMRLEEENRELQRRVDMEYDDEPTGHDYMPVVVHAGERDSDAEEERRLKGKGATGSSDEAPSGDDRRKGKGKKTPVQGQSFGARKKEQHKSSQANHNRRNRFAQKLNRGML